MGEQGTQRGQKKGHYDKKDCWVLHTCKIMQNVFIWVSLIPTSSRTAALRGAAEALCCSEAGANYRHLSHPYQILLLPLRSLQRLPTTPRTKFKPFTGAPRPYTTWLWSLLQNHLLPFSHLLTEFQTHRPSSFSWNTLNLFLAWLFLITFTLLTALL